MECFQAERAQHLQPVFVEEVLQPSASSWPLLGHFQKLHVFQRCPSGTFCGADVKGSCPRSSPEAQPGWVAAAGQDRPRLQQLQRRTGSSSTVGSALPKCRAKAPPWSLVAVRPQVQLPHGRAVPQRQAEPCSALCPPGACCHAVTELGLSGLWKSTVSPADLFLVPRPCFALGFQAYGLPFRKKRRNNCSF